MRTRRVVVGLVLLAAAVEAARYLGAIELLRVAAQATGRMGPWGAAFFVMLYTVTCVFFLPATPLTLGAGAVFGLGRGFALAWAGASLGCMAAFLVSRHLARRWVQARLASDRRLLALDRAVTRDGWKVVALTRLSPLFPFNVLNYAYGLTGIPFLQYAAASALGMMPGTLLYVWLGAAAGQAVHGHASPARWAFTAVGIAATAAVCVIVARDAKKALAADELGKPGPDA